MDLHDSKISLIDLSEQLPFKIDQKVKEQICFGETLIISCGHYEGDLEEEESESDWSCEESSEPTVSEEVKDEPLFEVKEFVDEEATHVEEEEEDDDNDFHFYFFPDCNKPPPPQNSKTSVIVVGGMPKINPATKDKVYCTCKRDKTGQCSCYFKEPLVPCHCGAKTKDKCTCSELKNICICDPAELKITCDCKNRDVCVCDPDGKIFPECTCDKIEKPCLCHPYKFPTPICKCKHKPKFSSGAKSSDADVEESYEIDESYEIEESYEVEEESSFDGSEFGQTKAKKKATGKEPCICQKPEHEKLCYCLKGESCTCLSSCICGEQRPCECKPEELDEFPCKYDKRKALCTCDAPKVCTCPDESAAGICKCFPIKVCTCKNPKDCKCFTTCECTNPCICDAFPAKPEECVCLKTPQKGISYKPCTCRCTDNKKIKKVRAGRQGYRWCHEIDPQHTYFDYAYGKEEKTIPEESKIEQFRINGLHEPTPDPDECPVHGVKEPRFEKKPRKPSLDCCSSVGGISICVEPLGEDKDKLLVQVVSYSSKEGAKTGSKLVSILDCNLHTMEENRLEHITKKDITKERRSYAAICVSGYYNKVTRICGDKHVIKRFYHSFEKAHNFVLEGSNIVLLRYIAIQRFKGRIKTDTVMMDGTICRSIYVCHGVSQGVVNGVPFYVVKVERHIIEPSGYVHRTLTVLSLRGYTVSHEWSDNCYILHINPLLHVNAQKDEIEQHEPLRDSWRQDLQLMSDFLDFKSTRVSEGGRYITESGTLTATVRDYLQAILLLRPQDTLHFTRHYFGSVLSALDLPHDDFFDPTSKHVRYYFFED